MTAQDNVITLADISKSYRLYNKPSDRIKETFHPFGKKYSTPFQALKNVSMGISSGETLGIVGRNGCGKSTLLQIICSIMPPTSGTFHVNGRISAILELGAGFNPEFTGRDNVFLNCSILGMERRTVEERIDTIIEFADIGAFIDQPVKTYSSGMAMRLAFSIAISVDPAILIVDEALAVGDAAFQRKCYAKIKSLQERGTTILFVSHDAGAVIELCNRAVLLEQGEVIFTGDPKKVISLYHKLLFAPQDKLGEVKKSVIEEVQMLKLADKTTNRSADVKHRVTAKGRHCANEEGAYYNENLKPKSTIWYEPNGVFISEPRILDGEGRKVNALVRNENYYFTYDVSISKHVFNVLPGMAVKTVRGFQLGGYGKQEDNNLVEHMQPGTKAVVKLKFRCSLLPGTYFLNAGVFGVVENNESFLHRGIDVVMFEVLADKMCGATGFVDFDVSSQVIYDCSN